MQISNISSMGDFIFYTETEMSLYWREFLHWVEIIMLMPSAINDNTSLDEPVFFSADFMNMVYYLVGSNKYNLHWYMTRGDV